MLFLGLGCVAIRLPLACRGARPASGTAGLQADFVPRAGPAHGWALLVLGAELQAEGDICVLPCGGERWLSGAGDSPVL